MIICVDIVGITEEQQGYMIKDAIEHTIMTMMPRRRNPVFIDVEICEEGDLGRAVAMVHEEGDDHYFMTIDRSLLNDPEYLIQTTCHETVHIVQGLKKQLKDVTANTKKWKGKLYNLLEVNYYELPWEQQAYSYELPLAWKVLKKYEL